VAKLARLGRIAIDLESVEFSRIFARVHVWPLDLTVCRQSAELDFLGDPADELIAATSIVHRVPLLTRDRCIRRFETRAAGEWIMAPSRPNTDVIH
jgi:PIN domain nuclease of toxin-antitoxin system